MLYTAKNIIFVCGAIGGVVCSPFFILWLGDWVSDTWYGQEENNRIL